MNSDLVDARGLIIHQVNESKMLMRFTLVDSSGSVSFVAPGHTLKMLTASVRPEESSIKELLDRLESLDERVAEAVKIGLSTFDEYCLRDRPETLAEWVKDSERLLSQPLRVLDAATRNASLEPQRLGLVIVNLIERRIVQVQNSYGTLLRSDRGRIRKAGKPTSRFYRYELPAEWTIVP